MVGDEFLIPATVLPCPFDSFFQPSAKNFHYNLTMYIQLGCRILWHKGEPQFVLAVSHVLWLYRVMMRSQSRTFPIFDRLGGRQVIAKAMTKSGFSENADRLLRSFLDREKISASGMMFLMSMADDKGIRIESQDFEFSSGHNVQRDANEAAA